MVSSRTAKTLTALCLSMVAGAVLLGWMETEPIQIAAIPLTAKASDGQRPGQVVFETNVPVRKDMWNNIIVRSATDQAARNGCHFVVQMSDDGSTASVHATDLWKSQLSGKHTFALGHDWNVDSIGVCVAGEIGNLRAGDSQFKELMVIVRSLQHHMRIPADRVYLHSDLDLPSPAPVPSDAFLINFNRNLLATQR